MGFPGGSAGKESACNAGDLDSIPELGRSPGEGNGYPLQYSGLENSMDYSMGSQSQTQLSDFPLSLHLSDIRTERDVLHFICQHQSPSNSIWSTLWCPSANLLLFFPLEKTVWKKSHHSHDHFPGIPCPTNHPTTSFDKMENGRESGCFKVFSQMLSYLILPSNPARYVCVLVAQSCPTLWDSMDCSPPGSSVYGILLARVLEWVAISSSRGSSQPRDQTHVYCVSCIGRQIHYHLSHQGSLKDLL